MKKEYATCLNCIDGRVQLPVIHWIQENYGIKYVDMITAPGINGIFAEENCEITGLLEKINISQEVHLTKHIFIVGHHDCLANPVNDENHIKQICEAINVIKKYNCSAIIVGLWVDSEFSVHKVYNDD